MNNNEQTFDEPIFVHDGEKLDSVLKRLNLSVQPDVTSCLTGVLDKIIIVRRQEFLKTVDDLHGVWAFLAKKRINNLD